MASASYHTQSPQRATQRKRRPAPEAVYQTFIYEVSQVGERRAASATAERYGISDDTVRRIVARKREQERVKEATPAELVYIAPPTGYPEPQPAAELPPSVTQYAAQKPQPSVNGERPLTSSSEREMRQSTVDLPQPIDAEARSAETDDMTRSSTQLPQPVERQTLVAHEATDPPTHNPSTRVRVVRVPIERPGTGVLQWLAEHEAARQQLIAVLVFLILVGLTWL